MRSDAIERHQQRRELWPPVALSNNCLYCVNLSIAW